MVYAALDSVQNTVVLPRTWEVATFDVHIRGLRTHAVLPLSQEIEAELCRSLRCNRGWAYAARLEIPTLPLPCTWRLRNVGRLKLGENIGTISAFLSPLKFMGELVFWVCGVNPPLTNAIFD